MMRSLNPCASVRLMVCAVWQSSHTGSFWSVFVTLAECTLRSNCF
jgi:hypothetical protein